jgi:adenylate cyclase
MKRSLFSELKRRNVLRAAAFYIAAVWALAQGIAQLAPLFGDYTWGARWFVIAGVIGFPFWVAFAWFYQFTPDGLKRESEIDPADSIAYYTGKKLDRWIFAIMGVAIVLLLTDRFVLHHGVNEEAAIAASDKSIAVLPFTDMSEKKDQEYLSDGISEDLLNLLTRVTQLQVTARTSSFAFKSREIGVPEIARRLHVAHVLEGSVRKAGNTVRITAQLVDAASDTQLWSQSYDRKLDDVFAIQDEIAADVVKQLRIKLLGAAPKAKPVSPDAYTLYLQGRQLSRQVTADSLNRAISLYQQALAIEPRYAAVWGSLRETYTTQADSGLVPVEDGYRRGLDAANKALALDPDLASAHAGLAWLVMPYDPAAAAQHLTRALALDANDPDVLRSSAYLSMDIGHLDTAIAIGEALTARDPVNPTSHADLGFIYLQAGRPDAAIASYRTALALSPGYIIAHAGIGAASLQLGQPRAALAEAQQEPNESARMIGQSMAWYALGNHAESDTVLRAAIQQGENRGTSYWIACAYAFRGDTEHAFSWLDKAIANKDPGPSEILSQPLLADLHKDPRWQPLLRKLGKAPEQLAKIEFKVALPQADGGLASGGAQP